MTTPFTTPWRAVMIGSTHAELVDSAELVLNLAPPNALADTSWIKPGKAFRCALTTAAGTVGVDFAVARGLQTVLAPGSSPYQKPVVVSAQTVTATTTLGIAMTASGGQAVSLRPS